MKSRLGKGQGCGRQDMPDHRGQDAVYIHRRNQVREQLQWLRDL